MMRLALAIGFLAVFGGVFWLVAMKIIRNDEQADVNKDKKKK